jgi:hypothetical protein
VNSLSSARPEHDLLLLCARTNIDPATALRIESGTAGAIDWSYLIATGDTHGVTPLLHSALSELSPRHVPEAALNDLRARFWSNTAASLFLTRELLDILQLLDSHGIRGVPYKGPALAAAVYRHVGLRSFNDLDLLLSRADVLRAKDLLVRRGYRAPRFRCRADEAEYIRTPFNYFYALSRPDRGGRVALELHWALPATFPLILDGMYRRMTSIEISGVAIPHFAPEDLLLILCAHGFKHFWSRLKWICDVAELARRHPELNWAQVLEDARACGAIRVVLLGVLLAHELLAAPVPADVVAAAGADRPVLALARRATNRLFEPGRRPVGVRSNLQVRVCWRDRVGYGRNLAHYLLVPTGSDRVTLPLPRWLSFLHYPLRPVRVLGRMRRKYR